MKPNSHCIAFSRVLLLLSVVMAVALQPLSAADRFLRVGSVSGGSTDPIHNDWSEIVDFTFGVSSPAGPAVFKNVTILKLVDKSSPVLFLMCCTAENIPTVQIRLTRLVPGGPPQIYYTLTLTNARITNVQSETGGSVPAESISFDFSKIQISYTPDSGGPAVTAGWDRVNNIPFP